MACLLYEFNGYEFTYKSSHQLPLGVSNAPMVRVKLPAKKDIPKPDDATFGGDLTAWYNAYCAAFDSL